MSGVTMKGTCAPGFEPLAQAFDDNFAERGEVGAALCVVQHGEAVVDLWGGMADPARGTAWQHDTLVNVWSTTKGLTAIALALLVDRGQADYDDRVADIWPEFAAHGKGDVTIGQLISHQAGLTGFREAVDITAFYDIEQAADRLARAAPFWVPGTEAGYHAIAVGFLADGLFRRIDGRSIRQFFAQEFAAYDIHLGLSEAERHRHAPVIAPPTMSSEALAHELTPAQIAALVNPPLDPLIANDPAWQAAQIPSANGFASARGIAALYESFLAARYDPARALVSGATLAAATAVRFEGSDSVLGQPARWAAGFLRNSSGAYGPNEAAFGHSGWGGSFAFADPERGWAVAYTMNRMGDDLIGDPRNLALMDVLYKVPDGTM
ncbi:MAG: serine hydrolase domain-containing protein [Erythrobacter sp.]|jgi:CubicO group peptidase (beta-lactamase class C family)|uniref:serine hydrolase domain-containing protein n=1 Tax=Erythrobacter sp. TaxID=1042 RepID=UPI002B47364F|nr:serine hydrolase domain-containing protein [Erythrobacter sp.]WRH69390.1 MAG: serine hydrolase domain-containing protein [Erythrobacter sp.]